MSLDCPQGYCGVLAADLGFGHLGVSSDLRRAPVRVRLDVPGLDRLARQDGQAEGDRYPSDNGMLGTAETTGS